MATLDEISLSNFKTFGGTHSLKISEKFILVAGPNGSGKSNFLDAIGFAMGAKLSALRVKRVEELVTAEHRTCQEASVCVTLSRGPNHSRSFKRCISTSSDIEHYVNDEKVTLSVYLDELTKMDMRVKIMNFMVFQDSIENIIMMKPIERTVMFEKLSGSDSYKSVYNRKKSQLRQYEIDLDHLTGMKRALTANIKAMKLSDQKAKEFLNLSKKNENAHIDLLLLNLHYGKLRIEKLMTDEHELRKEAHALAKKKYRNEKELGRLLEMREALMEEATRSDNIRKPKELEMKNIMTDLTKIRAKKQYMESRSTSARTSLQSAINADNARQSTIRELEDALEQIQKKKDEYFRKHSETLGKDFQLSETQIKEYENLKLKACSECATDNEVLLKRDREYKALQDIYDAESTKKNEAKFLVDQKRLALEVTEEHMEKLQNAITALRKNLDNERESYKELTKKSKDSEIEEKRLREEIQMIDEKLGDFEYDHHELNTKRKKEETVNALRRLGGVYDRLGFMCRTINDRYNVAVTKVLGKNFDAIVVDNTETAVRCIDYLKKNRLHVETFLPLANLPECKLSESFRNIKTPRNVKLIHDVILFEPKEVEKAVFYAVGNTLVCKTPDDASTVAYCLANSKNNCVSLDGCYYHKSGIMSGGNLDLVRKAQRLEMHMRDSLNATKDNLMTRLTETLTTMPRESDLKLLTTTISSLECRLKFMENDEKKSRNQFDGIKNELTVLEKRFESAENNWAEAKANMDKAFDEMSNLKSQIEAKENEIFAGFCRNIGVENIDVHESGKSLYEKTINDFNQQIDRIVDQLAFENNCDTKSNIKRWENNLKKAVNELESIVWQESQQESLLETITREFENSNSEYPVIEKKLNELSKEIGLLTDDIATMARKHKALSKRLNDIQVQIDKKKSEFHANLVEAKMSGFSIVSRNGQASNLSQSSDASVPVSDTYELDAQLEIDFTKLPEEFLGLDDNEIEIERERLRATIAEQAKQMKTIINPNMKASQHLILAKEKLAETNERLKNVQVSLIMERKAFDDVKEGRFDKFNKFFQYISARVDYIYKKLTGDPSAQAYLVPENPEEPYLEGIRYSCIAPGKRFQVNDNLSGGEKTIAALPLLFAGQRTADEAPPLPFQTLDEIDAALDHKNCSRVVSFLKNNEETKSIVVSHRPEFLRGVDTIFGIGRGRGSTTQIITLDLTAYRNR